MGNLKYKSRSLQPTGKPRIYFCCNHQEFEIYFEVITDAILSAFDCAIFFDDDLHQFDEDLAIDLQCMSLFVVSVTASFLSAKSHTAIEELLWAREHHIPVLPIMMEDGLEGQFSDNFGSLACIHWRRHEDASLLIKQLQTALPVYFTPPKTEGSWIFLSHSSADIDKVRVIRNQFEKNKQNPLAFHLKCLRTDTAEGCRELEDLIKREIDARDWFVFCESEAAKKSAYVNMEKDYVIQCGKKKIWTMDMSLPIEQLIEQVDAICAQVIVYISYRRHNRNIVQVLAQELSTFDFDIRYNEFLLPGEVLDETTFDAISNLPQLGFFVALISDEDSQSYMAQVELPAAIGNGCNVIVLTFGDVDLSLFCDPGKVRHYKLPSVPRIEDVSLIASLIEAETRRQIKGPMHQADAYTAISRIQEQLNYENRFHLQEAVLDHVTDSLDDYLEIYRFPCCGKRVVVGDGPVSRFRADGCCCAADV